MPVPRCRSHATTAMCPLLADTPISPMIIAIFDSDPDVVYPIRQALLMGKKRIDPHWATLDDEAREVLREQHLDILVCSTRFRYFTEAKRRNPGLRIIALTPDGEAPSYRVCRNPDRTFALSPLPVDDICAAVRALL